MKQDSTSIEKLALLMLAGAVHRRADVDRYPRPNL
jgi:hypothetical protein